MNILHAIDQVDRIYGGGSAQVVLNLAKAQAKLGHQVTIYASDKDASHQETPEGVKLVKFKTLFTFQKLVFPLACISKITGNMILSISIITGC